MGVKSVDSGGRNIKLYQAEFSDMGPLAESLDAGYSSLVCLVGGLKCGPVASGQHSVSMRCQDCLGMWQGEGSKAW